MLLGASRFDQHLRQGVQNPQFRQSLSRMKVAGIRPHEWKLASMYTTMVFQKALPNRVAIIVPFRDLHVEQKRSMHLKQFVPYMVNKDLTKSAALRHEFDEELNNIEKFLQNEGKGRNFLLGENFSELDCSVFPKLLQIQAAGVYFKGIELAGSRPGVTAYMERVAGRSACQSTRPTDEDLIAGWAKKGVLKES